ncbi:hypothetical protein FQN50_004695 [Emmonsiellopsis sp. PD_5]|nr:hypothetical protein FQN50_004695 [Emmonsiellopsis sp. PD_5]
MESPHEHQQSLLLSRIITNVEKLNEAVMVLNKSLQDVNVQNLQVELVAQMFKNYQSNVLFHLEGTWLRDLQSSLPATPAHTFMGIDNDPTKFPAVPPRNTEFHVQDINLPWPVEWHNSYHLVHQRFGLAAAGPHGRTTLHSLTELVKPGSWIQLVEATNVDFESNRPVVHLLTQLVRDVFTVLGVSVNMAQQMSDWLGDAPGGFEHIQDRLVDV